MTPTTSCGGPREACCTARARSESRFCARSWKRDPPEGLAGWASYYPSGGKEGEYYLYYFDINQPAEYEFDLPKTGPYRAEIIDPWEMTITPVTGTFEGRFKLNLPGRPHMAVRIQRVQ